MRRWTSCKSNCKIHSAEGELARSRAAAREQLRGHLLERALDLARVQAAERVDARVNADLVASFLRTIERDGGSN